MTMGSGKKSHIDDNIVINLYNAGKSIQSISRLCEVSYTAAHNRIRKLIELGKIEDRKKLDNANEGVISKCKHPDCKYLVYLSGIYGCYYIGMMHECRPCPPTENCTVYAPNPKGKICKDKIPRALEW